MRFTKLMLNDSIGTIASIIPIYPNDTLSRSKKQALILVWYFHDCKCGCTASRVDKRTISELRSLYALLNTSGFEPLLGRFVIVQLTVKVAHN